MPINITVDTAVTAAADRWLAYKNPTITAQRKARIMPATKYNLLVKAFNTSTVLLVAAVACAILFAYAAAVTFGAVALFVRFTSDGELAQYLKPNGVEVISWVRRFLFRAEVNNETINIFRRVGSDVPTGWTREVCVFDHAVWRKEVPLPE